MEPFLPKLFLRGYFREVQDHGPFANCNFYRSLGRIKLKGSCRELIWKASKQARKVGGILSRQSDLECRQWCHTGTPPRPCTRTLTVTAQPSVWINVACTGTHKPGRLGMISMEVTLHGRNPARKPGYQSRSLQSNCPDAKTTSQPNTGGRQGAQEISTLDHDLPWGVVSEFPTLTSLQGSKNFMPNKFWVRSSGVSEPPYCLWTSSERWSCWQAYSRRVTFYATVGRV